MLQCCNAINVGSVYRLSVILHMRLSCLQAECAGCWCGGGVAASQRFTAPGGQSIFPSPPPERNNVRHGPSRRGPRPRRSDRTADPTPAVLPPVGKKPTGFESAGGPPRTAAVAPPSYRPSIFLVIEKSASCLCLCCRLLTSEFLGGTSQRTPSWIEFPHRICVLAISF